MARVRHSAKFEAALLVILFAAGITLPLGKQVLCGEPDTASLEGRLPYELPPSPLKKLKRWKKWKTFKALGDYPPLFEKYYNDHFGFRAALLKLGCQVKVKCLGVSPNRDVVLGRSGWLFLRNDGTYRGTPNMSDADLERWIKMFESRQQWLAQRGIEYLYVIAPDKHSVYPEFLAETVPGGPLDQLTDRASLRPDLHFLSVRKPLLAAKGGERLYYQKDTHWNSFGAFAAYCAIMNELAQRLPELKQLDRNELHIEQEERHGDLARMIGIPLDASERETSLVPPTALTALKTPFWLPGIQQTEYTRPFIVENPKAKTKLRAVVLRDSFGTALAPFLAESFSRITVIWMGAMDRAFEQRLVEIVSTEKPDVFIEERVERALSGGSPSSGQIFGVGSD